MSKPIMVTAPACTIIKEFAVCKLRLTTTDILSGIVIFLTGTVGFIGLKYIEKAKVINTVTEMENLSLALNSFYFDCGDYPTTDQKLAALWQKPVIEPVSEGWNGPYVSKKPGPDCLLLPVSGWLTKPVCSSPL